MEPPKTKAQCGGYYNHWLVFTMILKFAINNVRQKSADF